MKVRPQLDAFHQQMRDMFIAELRDGIDDNGEIDLLLNSCLGLEYCEQCADIFCPWGEPLHFHHDGCPCCSMIPDEEWSTFAQKMPTVLLKRNTELG